jgi:hypothetical protein
VREGMRLVIAPSKAAWDDFFDSPGIDLPARIRADRVSICQRIYRSVVTLNPLTRPL